MDNKQNNTSKQEQEDMAAYMNRQAVALSYDVDDAAPRVVAAGRGHLAHKIIERAAEANVPLHKDEKLANTLSKLDIGDMIPPELYEVVAEILVFVDRMDRIKAKIDEKK